MRRGLPLMVLLLSLWLLVNMSRWGFFSEKTPAAFVPLESRAGVPAWLGDGFVEKGVHQFSDGETPSSAMKLTKAKLPDRAPSDPLWLRPLLPGERLDLASGTHEMTLRRVFLPAQHRMLLHIPLHPDRMGRADWEALPGVGPKLAAAIMIDRQKNGEFGTLEGVTRVKGIGPGRVKQWQEFFIEERQMVNK